MITTVHTPKYKALLKWLKTARIEQGLTVREVATLIDEPFQFISKIETGMRKLNVYEFVQYCEALGLDSKEGLEILFSSDEDCRANSGHL